MLVLNNAGRKYEKDGKEFQPVEVIGINELANRFLQFLSDLTTKKFSMCLIF